MNLYPKEDDETGRTFYSIAGNVGDDELYTFTADNGWYLWEFCVDDGNCPDDIFREVAGHCANSGSRT
ncbi:MAG: hypothetical protein GY754_08650 [bacterium]|nr:hypothetical protein [bacterium]